MANLLGANIGANYKGFLNLDSTINTPLDATLRSVTDGMGNVSPLQLSTDQVGLIRTVALSAGATNPRLFNEVYTINNSGAQTGTLTGIFLNATETALNGMTHNLMDLQVGAVSKFSIDRLGNTTLALNSALIINSGYRMKIFSSGNHNMTFQGGGGAGAFFEFLANDGSISYATLRQSSLDLSSITTIKIGGTTSSFPSIKRNGATIDFRLADDSAFCNLTANTVTIKTKLQVDDNTGGSGGFLITTATQQVSLVSNAYGTGSAVNVNTYGVIIQRTQTNADANASSVLEVVSTTQGFLPPRMTSTQKNAIVSPATGLVVFDTTLNKLAVFTTVWETITSI